jgi:hypothetical protein
LERGALGGLWGARGSWGGSVLGVGWGGVELDPCTTPSFGCLSKFLVKIHHFTIFLRDFSFFFYNIFLLQTQVKLCVLTV